MQLAMAPWGQGRPEKSLLFCTCPAQQLVVQQYLLKKQRRKSLFVLSPAIPMATLFGGSALFYFFFSPLLPCLRCKREKRQCLAHTIWRIGTEASLAFACPASFHVWTAMKRNELKGSSLFPSLSPFILSPHLQKLQYIINASYICVHTLST